MSHTILIYFPRADKYVALLEPLLPGVALIPCATPEEAARHVAEADIIFGNRFPPELLPRAARLKWLQVLAAGVDDLVTVPFPDGVRLARVEGLSGGQMSEYAFAHMLAHSQNFARSRAGQAESRWAPFRAGKLAGKRLGLAGAGAIGYEVARKAKAFDMEVWALIRSQRPLEHVDQLFSPDQAAAFTAGVDYLVSTLPYTPETTGLIDPGHMKQGALLINMGRGPTIDEEAILGAVRSGRIQAVLDVFEQEPLPPAHPFWTAPGITITPHIAGPIEFAEVAQYAAANYHRFLAGQPLTGEVDRSRGY